MARAVVIGGGISGVLVARGLLLDGWDVTVLEALHLGAGSSSRTAAGIRQQFSTPSTVRGMRYAVDFYKRFGDEAGATCLDQAGYLFLLGDGDAQAARARVAMQQAAGLVDVAFLTPAEVADRFAWVDAARISGATWCPTDGFLHPAVIYGEGARRVRELGGQIVVRAPVVRADHAGGRLVAVHTPAARVEADLFVDCTNAWSPRTSEILGGEPLPIAPIKRYLWLLRRDGPLAPAALGDMPLVVSPSGVYARPEGPEALLMGWAHHGAPEPAFTPEDQDVVEARFSHTTGADAVPYEAWGRFAEVVPAVAEFAGIQATTAGYYAVTPDHNPFLDVDPRVPNLLRMVGFSGHGAMFGPFTAAVAVALAAAGRSLPHLDLPTGRVELGAFAIGRRMADAEAMVI